MIVKSSNLVRGLTEKNINFWRFFTSFSVKNHHKLTKLRLQCPQTLLKLTNSLAKTPSSSIQGLSFPTSPMPLAPHFLSTPLKKSPNHSSNHQSPSPSPFYKALFTLLSPFNTSKLEKIPELIYKSVIVRVIRAIATTNPNVNHVMSLYLLVENVLIVKKFLKLTLKNPNTSQSNTSHLHLTPKPPTFMYFLCFFDWNSVKFNTNSLLGFLLGAFFWWVSKKLNTKSELLRFFVKNR